MKRDYSIDLFRGLACISIVFIHTVWWSGVSYVPEYISQISLLFDVPVFFFLAGQSAYFSLSKSFPMSGIIRLVGTCLVYSFLIGLIDGSAIKNIWNILCFHVIVSKTFPIFGGSLWFYQVYIVVYLMYFWA